MRAVLAATILLLVLPASLATVVVNSEDWRDVYTGLQYAAVTEQEGFFVVDGQQGADLATRLPQGSVTLITGRQQAMPGFRQLLVSRGVLVEERTSNDPIDLNQELAVQAGTPNVIVVDDAYGYNAISVGTYANIIDASVLFAEPGVADVIAEMDAERIILYGHIPSGILDDLSAFDAEIINEQDKFADNFALVERFQQEAPRQTVILTNGEFIERQLLADENPTLFIGRQNVPDDVIDFLDEQDFRISVLIGNALAPNAQYIKDSTGMSLFIKFAQGRNQQQFALDLYPIPIPNPLITIAQAEYDPTQQALLVTYQNPGEIATYFTGSFQTAQGTVEDAAPTFIEAGTHKTISYGMAPPEGALAYTVLYGGSPLALELLQQGTVDVQTIDVADQSELRIASATYDTTAEAFMITLENPSPVAAHALVELVDVRIGQDRVRIGGEVERIGAGGTADVEVPAELSEADLGRNQELQIEVFYGEREFSLIKFERATLAFDVTEGLPAWTWIVLAGIIAAILILWVRRAGRSNGPR